MRRGDVFRLRLRKGSGHEQRGSRFGVIVQSDALPLSTVLVTPTSRAARPASWRPEIDVDGDRTRLLTEQTGAIDPSRLGDHVGTLTPEERWGLDLALELVLDLDTA